MYLAFRDIVFAKGRFALIGGVVALITLLLVLLTGLTDGLGRQNTSALENLGASHIVFAAPDDDGDEPSFTESVITADELRAFSALPAYQSERGSLLMMQAFLYGISALVVVSFLTVWTIQRTRDLAVLRALGSSRGYLVRDSMTQAAFVVLLGAAAGGAAGAAGGAAVGSAVPFALTPMTILAPVLGVFVLGLIGAALATRRVTRIDPLLALGGN